MRFLTMRRVVMASAVAVGTCVLAPATTLAQATTTTGTTNGTTNAATGTANADTSGRSMAASTPMTTTDTMPMRSEPKEEHNYGWIGLLGLAGLAGLRRREPTVVHRETTVRDVPPRDGTTRDTMR